MFRRNVFDEVGGYDELMTGAEDQDLFRKMATKGRVVTVADVLYSYRYHLSNATLANGTNAVHESNHPAHDALAGLYMMGAMRLWAGQPPQLLKPMLKKKSLKWTPKTLMFLATALFGHLSASGLASIPAFIHPSPRFFCKSASERRETLRMAIRVVVVGMGPRGQDWLREIQRDPAYELVGCVDSDRSALARASLKGVSPKQCFTELSEALEQNNCDAVIVATSPESHVQPCELALGRGLGVMVEKPFTLHLRQSAGAGVFGETKQRATPGCTKLSLHAFVSHRATVDFRRSSGQGWNGGLPVLPRTACDGIIAGAPNKQRALGRRYSPPRCSALRPEQGRHRRAG